MPKIRVAIAGTVGKSVLIDTDAGVRALAAVEALQAQLATGVSGAINHNALLNLQVGDAHPQYTMWAANETITGVWNFATIPFIQGETLAEYIEEVVGGDGFIQDTASITWTYGDTAGTLEANVDLNWAPVWTNTHTWTDNDEVRLGTGGDLRLYHNGTNSFIKNETGTLTLVAGSTDAIAITSAALITMYPDVTIGGSQAADALLKFSAASGRNRDLRFQTSGVNRWLFRCASDTESGSNAGSNFAIVARQDDGSDIGTALQILRSNRFVRMPVDNQELQIGAGQDLRLYHDGTDSFIRNDTGILKLNYGANSGIWLNASGAVGFGGANYGTAGYLLQSNGSSAVPTWVTPSGGGGGAVGSLTFLSETLVAGAAATTLQVTGLNLDTDIEYEIEVDVDNATGSTSLLSLFYNADTTATNYNSIFTTGASNTSANNASIDGLLTGEAARYLINISRDFDGRVRAMWTMSRATGSNMYRAGSVLWTTTGANVTSLTISASVASTLSIGSRVRVWKKTPTGLGVPNIVRQATSLVITSNASFQTTSLTTPLVAGTYLVTTAIWCDAHATPDMEIQFQFTGTITNLNGVRDAWRITTPATSQDITVSLADTLYNMNDTSRFYVEYQFLMDVTVTGTFAMYARQVTSSGTSVTFLAGSSMTITRMV